MQIRKVSLPRTTSKRWMLLLSLLLTGSWLWAMPSSIAHAQTPGMPGQISGVVFDDLNGNSVQNGNEPGIADVTVTLQGGPVPVVTTTDAEGQYFFAEQTSGLDYTVVVTPPSGYVPTTPTSVVVPNLPADDDIPVNFGFQLGATITGRVFDDRNRNGIQDEGEPGIAGATVNLLEDEQNDAASTSSTQQIVRSTITDSQGNYQFENIRAGSYIIEIILPPGYVATTPLRIHITVGPGEESTVNFGTVPGNTFLFVPNTTTH